jgi:hypothetical protein
MNWAEKLKLNVDYLSGKSNSNLYSAKYESSKLSRKDWQLRWEVYGNEGYGFVWYGVDSIGNVAEFCCEESFVPEVFFQDVTKNNKLCEYFKNLSNNSKAIIPVNLRNELREFAKRNNDWGKEAERGVFIFDEPSDNSWFEEKYLTKFAFTKNPYELTAIPTEPLYVENLPKKVQELLQPYHFEKINFSECQFLDVSKHLYCEK